MHDWVELDVPNTAQAPAVARRFLREHARELAEDLVDDAQILVSELVTNAVRYGRPTITVGVRPHPPGLDVAVTDHGAAMPEFPSEPPGPESQSGRGLLIIDALSNTWGVDAVDEPPGKIVWFEMLPAGR